MSHEFIKTILLGVCSSAVLAGCGHMADMNTGRKAYKAENYDEAYLHYNELAEFGMPEAKVELGKLYLYGRGTEEDPAKALALFEEASDLGEEERVATYIPRAQAKLGSMILKDEVSGYSDTQAFAMLSRAAGTGNRNALFEMGYAYEKGLGVAPNGAKAAQYYSQSAAKGYSRAAFYEGRLYMKGDLVPQNTARALALYQQAATSGYPRAYTELGEIYEKGKLVGQDYRKAAEYYRKGAAEGEESAAKALSNLQNKAGQTS